MWWCKLPIGSVSHFEYAFEVSDSRCRFKDFSMFYTPDPWYKRYDLTHIVRVESKQVLVLNIKKCIGRQSHPESATHGVWSLNSPTISFSQGQQKAQKSRYLGWLPQVIHGREFRGFYRLFRSIFRKYLGLKTGWFFTPIFCAVGRAENLQQNTKKLLKWSWDASPYTHTTHTHICIYIYMLYFYSTYIYIYTYAYIHTNIYIYIYTLHIFTYRMWT